MKVDLPLDLKVSIKTMIWIVGIIFAAGALVAQIRYHETMIKRIDARVEWLMFRELGEAGPPPPMED